MIMKRIYTKEEIFKKAFFAYTRYYDSFVDGFTFEEQTSFVKSLYYIWDSYYTKLVDNGWYDEWYDKYFGRYAA